MIPENWAAKRPPPQDEGKNVDFRSIHFRQFRATLVFVAEKLPPPQDEGKFFDIRSIHFRQFQATLVFVAEKPPSRMKENFLTSDLSISGNFEQLWFLWQKSPPPPKDEGKFFDIRSIHFRQFWATLVFVAEKPPSPRIHHRRTSTRYERLYAGHVTHLVYTCFNCIYRRVMFLFEPLQLFIDLVNLILKLDLDMSKCTTIPKMKFLCQFIMEIDTEIFQLYSMK